MSQTFKIFNTSSTFIGSDLNYRQLPLFQRYIALQIGDYKMTTISNDINGWLICDGRSLAIADYPELFAVIGTSFGSVDEEHFNIPNYTSRSVGFFGPHTGGGGRTAYTIGQDIGAENTTLSINQLPSHSHTGTTDPSGVHSHTTNSVSGSGTLDSPAIGLAYSNGQGTTISTDSTNGEVNTDTTPIALVINNSSSHTHTFTSNNTGSGDPVSILPPTLFGAQMLIFATFGDFSSLTPITY